MKRRGFVIGSGLLWLFAGSLLLRKGFFLIDQWVLFGLAAGAGYFKGRYVLSKTVDRVVGRIDSLPEPVTIRTVYPLSYWFLILGMMGLGIVCKWLPDGVRGVIDTAIGVALVYGASLYFRRAYFVKPREST